MKTILGFHPAGPAFGGSISFHTKLSGLIHNIPVAQHFVSAKLSQFVPVKLVIQHYFAFAQVVHTSRDINTSLYVIDVSTESISNMERGIYGPKFENLEKIAGVLKVPVKELFEFGK